MFKFKKKRAIRLAVFIFLFFLLGTSVTSLKTPLSTIFKNPLSFVTLIKREFAGMIFYHRNFVQNKKLKNETYLLRQKIQELNELYLENSRLKKLLSLKQNSPYKLIAAYVIGRSPDNWSSVIIIGKGTHHGIRRGYVALSSAGLIGRVIEAAPSTSKIMLLNDPDLSVSSIGQRSRQEGLVSGTLGSYLHMRYLPKDADIKISDCIITSGLTENYPKGLLIGTVVDIKEEFSGLSKYAVIKPDANLSNIEEVLIIIP